MLATAGRMNAQVKIGDLSADLTATISGGYTADYGNETASDHGFTAGGAGTLTGSYHDPNFLSFNILPFYNQSRAVSGYQSITDASGVTASTSIFGGSYFPGSITYSKLFNSEGNFGFPGLPNYTTHGDSDLFGVTWGEYVPNLPSLSVSYQQGTNDYSLYGASGNSVSDFRTISGNSAYRILGFNLNGSYHYSSNQLDLPEIFADQPAEKSNSESSSYAFGIGHSLPFNGNASASVSRSDVSADYSTGNYNATIDTVNAGISFLPIDNLHIGANAQYLDNLTGTLYQSIIAAGGEVAPNTPAESSHSLDVTGYGNYEILPLHTTISGVEEHRDQTFFGQSFTSDTITGTGSYANFLLGGFVTATLGVTRTSIEPTRVASLGLIGSVNYARQIRRWTMNAAVNYNQNAQTILISYTTSSYGYSGSAGRKIGRRSYFNLSANGSKSGLTNDPGSSSFSQGYSGSFSTRYVSATGAFTRASGNSILTAAGLVATPIPLPVVTPSSVILYGGNAYSFGVGGNPMRGLTISASYSKAVSATQGGSADSNNRTAQAYAYLQYKFRKVYLNAGYSRLAQSFSGSGTPPVQMSSYYVGISRWFNFF